MVWGAEPQFENHLGYYVACGIVDNFLNDQHTFYSYLEPGRQASVYSIRGNRLATFFAFKSPHRGRLSRQQQHELLEILFSQAGWVVPQLLEAMKQSSHFFFDAVSQIRLNTWRQGRVALVGDACQCLTLLAGQGASMAMAGAYSLATCLHETGGRYEDAFQMYQDAMLPDITRRQAEARKLANSFVPDSALSIALMNLFLRFAFLPGFRSIFLGQIGAKSIIK
jgi:2-polyprenyl-6-methoxyphenol hydroxylase-like FAD-dependent oxidoreductase